MVPCTKTALFQDASSTYHTNRPDYSDLYCRDMPVENMTIYYLYNFDVHYLRLLIQQILPGALPRAKMITIPDHHHWLNWPNCIAWSLIHIMDALIPICHMLMPLSVSLTSHPEYHMCWISCPHGYSSHQMRQLMHIQKNLRHNHPCLSCNS